MAFTVSVGEADFAALRNENAYYVDKSEIMYELVHDTNNKVALFTRPRRFGKTLMLSMMENFFSVRKDSKSLFENKEQGLGRPDIKLKDRKKEGLLL